MSPNHRSSGWAFVGAGALLWVSSTASAADVYLQAQRFDKALPWGEVVPMWGYAECAPGWVDCTLAADMDSPGPVLRVDAADSLTIHLSNTLPTPVSVLIPGLPGGGDPTFTVDGLGRQRARSLTHETAPGGTADYTWSTLRPGTFLYESGTQPSIQVPMGLVGALVVGPATGPACATGQAAYDTDASCYDADSVLVYSELDPWLNEAIDAAGGDPAALPSTVDYEPAYFFVNGQSTAPVPAGAVGDRVLVRMVNAGLKTHIPSIVGIDLGLIAEDGYPYPGVTRRQTSVTLSAGKTLDLLLTPPADDATYALYDRMPSGSSDVQPDAGLAQLVVGLGSDPEGPPTTFTVPDVYDLAEDTSLVGSSVLDNDVGLAGATVSLAYGPSHGALTLLADGTFTYSPEPDFAGLDTFTYTADDGTNGYAGSVTLRVALDNDAPVAADDGPYVNAIGPDIAVDAPGVMGNDSDPDGDLLAAVLDSPPATGALTLNLDGSFTYTGGAPGTTDSFTYHVTDGIVDSATVTVTLRVNPVANLALSVVDPQGVELTDFRWVVQEDVTYAVDPNAPPPLDGSLATLFHKSYVPVVAQGAGVAEFAQVALDPEARYYVSVLPDDAGTDAGRTMGGAQVLPGMTAVRVKVNNQAVKTAQVSVIVFEDNQPTNGVPDPVEPRLGGFQITLEDAGGRYGMSGGPMSQDGYGNPLTNSLDCFGGAPPAPGVILTCPDGTALIKNLPPGKYGVTVVPPAGSTEQWVQTSTIEGSRVIDTWVAANEPPFMVEFGRPAFHAFIGFVSPSHTVVPPEVPAEERNNTITGNITLLHDPRPPATPGLVQTGSFEGLSYTRAWIGLNSVAGDGPNYAIVQADPEGNFVIEGIPDGTYQLVVWDDFLDIIIAFQTVTVSGGAGAAVGDIPVNAWFTRMEHNVFLDANQDGVRQAGEEGLPEQNVNIRFRDGSMFLTAPTDTEGFVPFDEVFPFFDWQVAEVDFARFKPTGATVLVDAGGDVSGGPHPGVMFPQVGTPRTETGPVLLEAFQGFPGQTQIIDWGKAPYAPGENGGISGIVFYAATRGEDDPRLTVGDPWEAGIPSVKVRLYREVATDLEGGTTLSLVQEVETDSWDASPPTGCLGEDPTSPYTTQVLGLEDIERCYDGWRNWNQVRPGVFDGGYAFTDIPPGTYVVEVVPPPGFELVKEEDKNVDFGDLYATAPVAMMLPGGGMVAILPDLAMVGAAISTLEPGLAQPPCVGAPHLVPAELSLFPGVETYAPFAGTERPLCDRKQVVLDDQAQAAADFHLFTSTPLAAQFTGLITDDISAETNPASPAFGEKWSPAYLPFSMRDFAGNEVYRGYSDAFGHYNGVVPSTFSANVPIPSGYSPAMYSTCLNDPGDGVVPDPLTNPAYGSACYTLQFMPRTTSYLDTPILPQSAFAAGFSPVDCAPVTGTPAIAQVDGDDIGPVVSSGGTLTLRSQGFVQVPNPAYEGPLSAANVETVQRDFGFGVVPGAVTVNGTPLENVIWTNDVITGTLPVANAGSGRLSVVRGDNDVPSVSTVTVTVDETPIRVTPGPGALQAAVDAAAPGSLILVEPGVYSESVILWKPLRLQGSGAGVTVIDAVKNPTDKLEAWQVKVQALLDAGAIDLLDGQPLGFDLVGPGLFANELGAGVMVLAKDDGSFEANASRIDGFTITGAEAGGGVFVNAFAHDLEISNNVVTRNTGALHGGIRVGTPYLPVVGDGPFGFNTNVDIHHNSVTLNGAVSGDGAGGGISVCTGSDDYRVTNNFVCGNYTAGDGGGIAHLGLSDGGVIGDNDILFNQSINQGLNRSGGGVYVGGEPVAPPALSLGAGEVIVSNNRIEGNQAASGHGGGLRLEWVNGRDVELAPDDPTQWYPITVVHNLIVNNVAGWSGGGVSLQDAVNVELAFDTIANNDSTATVGAVFDAVTNTSTPQPAGLSSAAHSDALAAVISPDLVDEVNFSNPILTRMVIWHNRSFSYAVNGVTAELVPALDPIAVGDCPAGADYWDLGVLDPAFALNPTYSILTEVVGTTNASEDPAFRNEYCNGARELSRVGPIGVTPAGGEGGNFIDARYGPLTLSWPVGAEPYNYHLGYDSAALNARALRNAGVIRIPFIRFREDIDHETRILPYDLGADEVMPATCSANSTNAGAPCYIDRQCLPNTGPVANRGHCDLPF
ncbi:MAG: Ig-like domain-containing protein [Myxococcota bacterium]